MKKLFKKRTAGLLSMLLVLFAMLLPERAAAQFQITVTNEVGGTNTYTYTTLSDALSDSEDGAEIVMTEDYDASSETGLLAVGHGISLNLGSYNLSLGSHTLMVRGNLNILGSGTIQNDKKEPVVQSSGTLSIEHKESIAAANQNLVLLENPSISYICSFELVNGRHADSYTVTLLQDISISSSDGYSITGNSCVWDLNGHKIINSGSGPIVIAASDATIKGGEISSSSNYTLINTTNMTLEDVTVANTTSSIPLIFMSGSTTSPYLTIHGDVQFEGNYSNLYEYGKLTEVISNKDDCSATVKDGVLTVTCNANFVAMGYYGGKALAYSYQFLTLTSALKSDSYASPHWTLDNVDSVVVKLKNGVTSYSNADENPNVANKSFILDLENSSITIGTISIPSNRYGFKVRNGKIISSSTVFYSDSYNTLVLNNVHVHSTSTDAYAVVSTNSNVYLYEGTILESSANKLCNGDILLDKDYLEFGDKDGNTIEISSDGNDYDFTERTDAYIKVQQNRVFSIGENCYFDIRHAIAAANKSSNSAVTIIELKDYTKKDLFLENGNFEITEIKKDITLKLGEYSCQDTIIFDIQNGAKLTINGTKSQMYAKFYVGNRGTLVINGGNYDFFDDIVEVSTGGNVTINGGVFNGSQITSTNGEDAKSGYNFGISGTGVPDQQTVSYIENNGGTVTITAGEFKEADGDNYPSEGFVNNDGDMIIGSSEEDAAQLSVTATTHAVKQAAGTVTINGGKFTKNNDKANNKTAAVQVDGGNLYVNDSPEFEAVYGDALTSSDGVVEIKGGKFSSTQGNAVTIGKSGFSITDGNFSGVNGLSVSEPTKASITGGEFTGTSAAISNTNSTHLLAEGYAYYDAKENGNAVVEPDAYESIGKDETGLSMYYTYLKVGPALAFGYFDTTTKEIVKVDDSDIVLYGTYGTLLKDFTFSKAIVSGKTTTYQKLSLYKVTKDESGKETLSAYAKGITAVFPNEDGDSYPAVKTDTTTVKVQGYKTLYKVNEVVEPKELTVTFAVPKDENEKDIPFTYGDDIAAYVKSMISIDGYATVTNGKDKNFGTIGWQIEEKSISKANTVVASGTYTFNATDNSATCALLSTDSNSALQVGKSYTLKYVENEGLSKNYKISANESNITAEGMKVELNIGDNGIVTIGCSEQGLPKGSDLSGWFWLSDPKNNNKVITDTFGEIELEIDTVVTNPNFKARTLTLSWVKEDQNRTTAPTAAHTQALLSDTLYAGTYTISVKSTTKLSSNYKLSDTTVVGTLKLWGYYIPDYNPSKWYQKFTITPPPNACLFIGDDEIVDTMSIYTEGENAISYLIHEKFVDGDDYSCGEEVKHEGSLTVNIDNSAPTLDAEVAVSVNISGGSEDKKMSLVSNKVKQYTYFLVNGKKLDLTISASDNLSNLDTVKISGLGKDTVITAFGSNKIKYSYFDTIAETDNIVITAKDKAGNEVSNYCTVVFFNESTFSDGTDSVSNTEPIYFYRGVDNKEQKFTVNLNGNSLGSCDEEKDPDNISISGNTITFTEQMLEGLVTGTHDYNILVLPNGYSEESDNPQIFLESQKLKINLNVVYDVLLDSVSVESLADGGSLCGDDSARLRFYINNDRSQADYVESEELGVPEAVSTENGYIDITIPNGHELGKIYNLTFYAQDTTHDDVEISPDFDPGSDYYVQLSDVLWTIDNSDDLFGENGSYQWYLDGSKVSTDQYIYLPSVINDTKQHSIYADVTYNDGTVRKVCPDTSLKQIQLEAPISKAAVRTVKAYPNPAVAGQELTLELENFSDDEYPELEIMIYSQIGTVAGRIRGVSQTNTLSLPSGAYTGMVLRDGRQVTNFKIIVK